MAKVGAYRDSFHSLKTTDLRRIKKAPPIQDTLFHGQGTTNQNTGKGQYSAPQSIAWNDRRNPPAAGTPSYVRQGPKSPAGGAARSY